MGIHLADPNLQRHACKALRVMAAYTRERQLAVSDAGGMQAVVTCLLSHLADAETIIEALRCLCVLTEENQCAFADQGGIGAVLSTMQAHPTLAQVQAIGSCALWKGVKGQTSYQKDAIDENSIPILAAALRQHTKHPETVEHAASALRCIVEGPLPKAQRLVRRDGVVPLLVKAMPVHAELSGIQAILLAALTTCVEGSAPNRVDAMSAGALEGTLKALQKHREYGGVTTAGTCLLAEMAIGHRASQVSIGRSGAIQEVLVGLGSEDALVQAKACAVVANLALNHDAMPSEAMTEALRDAVLKMVRHRKHVAQCQSHGAWALSSFCFASSESQRAVREGNGISLVLGAMQHFANDPTMQQHGATLITAAANSVAGRLLATKLSGPRVLLTALSSHMGNAAVCREVLRGLSTLASNSIPNQRMLGEKGAIGLVLEAMELHGTDAGTVLEACRMLSSLCLIESTTVGVGFHQHMCKALMFEGVPAVMHGLHDRFSNNAAICAAAQQVLRCTSKSYDLAAEDGNVVMNAMKQIEYDRSPDKALEDAKAAEEEEYGEFPSSRGTMDTDTLEGLIGREVTPTASEAGLGGFIPRPPSTPSTAGATSRTVTPSWKGAARKRREDRIMANPDKREAMRVLGRSLRRIALGRVSSALHLWHNAYMESLVHAAAEARLAEAASSAD